MTQKPDADRARGASGSPAYDGVTNLVLRQFPDEALMRRRAYSQTLNRGKTSQRPAILEPTREA